MQKINLRELYPDVYKTDVFVDVAEEVLAAIQGQEQGDAAYERRKFRHKERSIPMSQLMQTCSPATTDELVDIREVAVDKALPKEERIAAFLHQIKNPYRFRCGDFVVNAAFANNGVTLEECLQGILR